MKIQLTDIVSSNVKALGYNGEAKILRVKFMSGSIYDYSNVSADLFESLSKSESKGKFLNQNIVKKPIDFPYVKVISEFIE